VCVPLRAAQCATYCWADTSPSRQWRDSPPAACARRSIAQAGSDCRRTAHRHVEQIRTCASGISSRLAGHARRVTSQRRRPLLRLDRYICRQRACPPCMPIESVCRSPPLRRRTAWPFLCAEVPHSAVASRRPAAPAPVAWRARRMRDPCSGDAPDPQPSRATRPGSLGRSPGWDGAMCLPQPAYRVHSQQDVVNYPRRRPRCAD